MNGHINHGHNQNTINIDIQKLINHPNYQRNRCPFILESKAVNAVALVPMEISSLKVQLSTAQVRRLLDRTAKRKYSLHLRLFSCEGEHIAWQGLNTMNGQGIFVYVNGTGVGIKNSKPTAGIKKKGYIIAKPLDISQYISHERNNNTIEIDCKLNFVGIVVAELADHLTTEQMCDRVLFKYTGTTGRDKKCAVCNKKQDLLRCSRCKVVWYCNEQHQREDWGFHQKICHAYKTPTPLIKFGNNNQGNDEDIILSECRIKLRCPLTIARIKVPVRGIHCDHPQCFDLRGYLNFCRTSGVWQCPVCSKPCRFSELGIDDDMENR
eukprot:UN33705